MPIADDLTSVQVPLLHGAAFDGDDSAGIVTQNNRIGGSGDTRRESLPPRGVPGRDFARRACHEHASVGGKRNSLNLWMAKRGCHMEMAIEGAGKALSAIGAAWPAAGAAGVAEADAILGRIRTALQAAGVDAAALKRL